jgi:hypothetical protein
MTIPSWKLVRFAAIPFVAGILAAPIAAAQSPAGPAKPRFASCLWWNSLKTDELYRLGFAQGMALGALVDPLPNAPPPEWKAVFDIYQNGQETLLQKPARLGEYFTAKCADPKNAQVLLHGLALLGTFEIGGLPADRLDAALELYRQTFAPVRVDVLSVLVKR